MPQSELVIMGKVENSAIARMRQDIIGVRSIFERTPPHMISSPTLENLRQQFKCYLAHSRTTAAELAEDAVKYGSVLADIIGVACRFRVARYYLVFSPDTADAMRKPLILGGEEYGFHKLLRHISRLPHGCKGSVVAFDSYPLFCSGIDLFSMV